MPRFPGEFFSPSAPCPSSSASFTLSSLPPPPPNLFLFFILYGTQPVFRPWSPLYFSSNLLSSLLLFSSSVSTVLIQTASSHLHLGFSRVLFPLKHFSITALGYKSHPSLLCGQPTVSYYYCSTLFFVSRYL